MGNSISPRYFVTWACGNRKDESRFAIASTFGLDLYILSLNSPDTTEDDLVTLFSNLPPPRVVLLEDIDVAGVKVDRSTNKISSLRRSSNDGAPPTLTPAITLAALLNSLDGVSIPEGIIFIGTTNFVKVLDLALKRPGRFDMIVPFTLASKDDIKGIFLRIYSRFRNETIGRKVRSWDINAAANHFADSLPSEVFSAADIQELPPSAYI